MQLNKIVLISTNRYTDPSPVFPLALAYLSAFLSKRLPDLEIHQIDFNLHSQEQCNEILRDVDPDLIGISIRNVDTVNSFNDSHFIEDNKCLLEELREKFPRAKFIIGGAGFSIFPKDIFNLLNPDFGMIGEGEYSLYQLINCLRNDEDYSDIEGLIYRKEEELILNRRKTYLESPEVAYNDEFIDYYWNECGIINLQTKRGCPNQCVYCTYPLIEGRKIRMQKPEKTVEILTKLKREKGVDFIFFTDSVFNVNNDHNRELTERIIASNLGITWGAYFTPHNLDESLLRLFKKSGLTHIEFGTESLSNSTLKSYQKHFTFEEIRFTSKLCNKLEINAAHFLILGGLGDTEEYILETIHNSEHLDKTVFFPFYGMRIYPGTAIYNQAIKEGRIEKTDSILNPTYYLVDNIDYKKIKDLAGKTKNRWIFPDEDYTNRIEFMRKKGFKGPLWEHLIR
ncbi:radical SAM protein [bacterium]|nr:radical SAM protein [bacterium]